MFYDTKKIKILEIYHLVQVVIAPIVLYLSLTCSSCPSHSFTSNISSPVSVLTHNDIDILHLLSQSRCIGLIHLCKSIPRHLIRLSFILSPPFLRLAWSPFGIFVDILRHLQGFSSIGNKSPTTLTFVTPPRIFHHELKTLLMLTFAAPPRIPIFNLVVISHVFSFFAPPHKSLLSSTLMFWVQIRSCTAPLRHRCGTVLLRTWYKSFFTSLFQILLLVQWV